MGVVLTIDGADYSKSPTGLILPAAQDALLYANFFGEAAGNQARNLAPGKPGGLVTGLVPPRGQFAEFNASNYVDTGIPDQDAVTLIAVCGQAFLADNTFGYAIGSYVDGPRSGANILMGSAAPHNTYGLVGRNTGGVDGNFGVGSTPSTVFSFVALRTSSAYGAAFDNKSNGGSTGALPLGGPRMLSGSNYLIGRAPINGNGVNGNLNVCFAAIFSRVLTDAELEVIYRRIQRIMPRINAGLGI